MVFMRIERSKLMLARYYISQNMLKEAFDIYSKIAARLSKKTCLEHAAAMTGMGSCYFINNEMEQALDCYIKAVEEYKQLPCSDRRDIHIAVAYNDMCSIFCIMRDYSQALKYSDLAFEILDNVESPDAEQHLSNLYNTRMVMFAEQNNLSDFRDLFCKILENINRADPLVYFNIESTLLENIRRLLSYNMNRPREMLQLIYDIQDNIKPGTPLQAELLFFKSRFYRNIGSSDQAMDCALSCLDCNLKAHGQRSSKTVEAYILTADVYRDLKPNSKWYNESEERSFTNLYTAIDILNSTSFSNKIELLADAYHSLAMNYLMAQNYDDALNNLQKSLDFIGQIKDNSNPAVFNKLEMFVTIYCLQERYQAAFEYAVNLLKISKQQLKNDKLNIFNSYSNVIFLALIRDDAVSAVKYTNEMLSLWQYILDIVSDIPDENLRINCIRDIKDVASLVFNTAFTYSSELKNTELYNFALKISHIDTELDYAYSKMFTNSKDEAVQNARKKLSELEKYIADMIAAGNENSAEYAEISRQIESTMGEMQRLTGADIINNILKTIQAEDVRKELKDGEVLIEYGIFNRLISGQNQEPCFVMHYYAFAVTHNTIELYLLASVEEIDSAVNDIINKIEQKNNIDVCLDNICHHIIQPFEEKIKCASAVYIVPDGELYRLPFELLADRIHNERVLVSYLSSGRELLRNSTPPVKREILVVADPKYSLEGSDIQFENDSSPNGYIYDNTPGFQKFTGFEPLYFADMEAKKIASHFKDSAHIITGKSAIKNAVLGENIKADILHISTHGYYESVAKTIEDNNIFRADNVNYYFRCGLAFAGANNLLDREYVSYPYEDGILSAKEISIMNLSKYRLAVLAACSTARGDIQFGEGIKDLRHAFELAGVGSLIGSLWNVDDFAGAVLMDKFYEELLKGDMVLPSEALKKAKQYVKNVTSEELLNAGWGELISFEIDKLLSEGQDDYANVLQNILDKLSDSNDALFSHPFYWAGFIFQGHC